LSADALIERFEQDKSRALGNSRRRDAGLYYTPRVVADAVVQIALRHAGIRPHSVLDPCAGAGAFLVAAARAGLHGLEGTDLDPDALAVAREALRLCGSSARLTRADALSFAPAAPPDLVISNPPYIPPGAIPRDPEVRDYDPSRALYGSGEDGLDEVRAVERTARRLLRPGGFAVVEHADQQGNAVYWLFAEENGWRDVRLRQDLTGRDRFVTARLTQD